MSYPIARHCQRSRGTRAPTWIVAAATMALLWGYSSRANAFCQTTTCDPEVTCEQNPEDCCIPNALGCDTNGEVIRWPSSCVSYSVHELGSPKLGLDAAQVTDFADQALDTWMRVRCGGAPPSIAATNFGLSSCGTPVFDEAGGANANVWQFSDESWPYSRRPDTDSGALDASALALTLISFNFKTAEILDADVVFNSASVNFSTGEPVTIDLLSIATHEAGHFLGLDHSNDASATMAPSYNPGTISPRTLSSDDAEGLCASYPPDRPTDTDNCEPEGGYTSECSGGGCSCVVAGSRGTWPFQLTFAGFLGLVWFRRRRSRV